MHLYSDYWMVASYQGNDLTIASQVLIVRWGNPPQITGELKVAIKSPLAHSWITAAYFNCVQVAI